MNYRIEPPDLDKELGMDTYLTDIEGFGGAIREKVDDFLVEEVLYKFGVATPIKIDLTRGGRYLLCVVFRKNWETIHLVLELARRLRIPRRCVGFAGLKDKRAYVRQFISLEGIDPNKVSSLRFKGVEVYPKGFMGERLSSKFLMGNRFTITVRRPSLKISKVREIIGEVYSRLKEQRGFLNFYGYQRFGSIRPITHLVGRLMVRRRFDEAIRVYMGYVGMRECEEARIARLAFIHGEELKKVYKLFPRRFIYERMILRSLMKFPGDYLRAFKALPIGLRRLFINAYQGYLFNRLLSSRMLEGLPLDRALKGDWVLGLTPRGFDPSLSVRAENSSLDRLNKLLADGKACLALPIFGYLSKLSDGEEGMIERSILNREGISSLKSFYVGALPEVSGKGGLRPILAPFKSFRFEILDESIRFRFFLYKECYASMLLREFIKPKDPIAAGF